MWLKNPFGKNSFCKSVNKIYLPGHCLGAGRDWIGEDILRGKEQIYVYVCVAIVLH